MISKKILLYTVLLFIFAETALGDFRFFPAKTPMINTHTTLFNSFELLDVSYIYSTQERKSYNAVDFGVKFVIFNIQSNDEIEFELCGLGNIKSRFDLNSESYNFVIADFFGGFSIDFKYKNLIFETILYHISSHLGDDSIYYGKESYANVGWEAFKQYINYNMDTIFDLTVGFEYKLSSRPDNIIFYDKSFLLGFKLDFLSLKVPLFLESEMEVLDFDHAPNIGAKLGLYLHYFLNNTLFNKGSTGREHHILYFQFYHGYSKLGYFYNRKRTILRVGSIVRF